MKSVVAAMSLMLAIGASTAFAQNPPLSLADLLIGLRSKKVTIDERNQILTGAVKERGVTFAFTPEIEKELTATGADANLIAAVKAKSQPVKPVAVATPQPTPPPPDAAFFAKRGDDNVEKGELDAAFNDYTKAVEMKGDDAQLFIKRGRTLASLKSYDRSLKDFDKAIELSPKTAVAFLNRGASYEKLGDPKKALADYKKAAELEPANDAAKTEAKRLQDQFDKEEEARLAAERAKTPVVVKPEFLNLGALTSANATRMVTPTYSAIARQSRVQGKVVVEVEIDAQGDVTSAKTTDGHAMLRQAAEDAAKKSKFKPATFNGEAIKAKGYLTYNFTL